MSGFTAAKLGLEMFGNEPTGTFEEARDGCPHKGTDFSSGGTPQPFRAGIAGKVVWAPGGQYGTITIEPHHEPGTLVQYLHCSRFNVQRGDHVLPDTFIGETGSVGTSVVHLHLHVWKPGNSKHPCWVLNAGSASPVQRNFVDPETWATDGWKDLDGTENRVPPSHQPIEIVQP